MSQIKYFGDDNFSIETNELPDGTYSAWCYVLVASGHEMRDMFLFYGNTESEAYEKATNELKKRLRLALNEL